MSEGRGDRYRFHNLRTRRRSPLDNRHPTTDRLVIVW